MFSQVRLGLLPLVGLLILAVSTVRCDCDTGTDCVVAGDCFAEIWNGPGCTAEQGHWECVANTCFGVCDPECTQASECEDLAWPAAVGCDQADGHWECNQESCEAVCDGSGCSQASDCDSEAWPAEAGCEQADGHWECNAQVCEAICDPGCSVYQDCQELPWPIDADCQEVAGHWECVAGACETACNAECNQDQDCFFKNWPEGCGGHWDCVQGMCQAVCDEVGCSDANCDREAGEADDSCPVDCVPPCAEAVDCVGAQDWNLPCAGRWDCEAGQCVEVCDYNTCGDAQCLADQGEEAQTCPADCFGECQVPGDCIFGIWTQMCQGHWNCFANTCSQICESMRCGDGTCSAPQGESSDACFEDCLGGPCAEVSDCIGYRWYARCLQGHWECKLPKGACEAVCEGAGCGDGTCDVLAGETPSSCSGDCQTYECDTSADCAGLALPGNCSGPWLCVGRACSPVCEP
jgi:hypothetical protein